MSNKTSRYVINSYFSYLYVILAESIKGEWSKLSIFCDKGPARGMALRKLSILLVIFELEPIVFRDSFCVEELPSEFFWRLLSEIFVTFYSILSYDVTSPLFCFLRLVVLFFYVCSSCQLSISSSKFFNV